MTTTQMIMAVASTEAINWIGKDAAEAIFDAIVNKKKPSGQVLIEVANLSNAIGRDKAEAIFNELMTY